MRLIAIILLLANVAIAQQVPTPETTKVRGFLGLNTVTPDELTDPRYFRIAHNVDWSRHGVPSLGMRYGYDSVEKKSGIDSLTGIYSANYADESRQLFYTADSSGIGWGYNYACLPYLNTLSSAVRINIPVSIISPSSSTTHDDAVYTVHGSAYGTIHPKGHPELSQSFPLQPPGSPLVTPIKTSGALNGSYRYALIYHKTGEDSVRSVIHGDTVWNRPYYGVLSRVVSVTNGKVLLSNFEMPTRHQVGITTKDTCRIILLRTVGDFAPIDKALDSLYYIVDTLRLDSANFAAFQYTDTSSDVTIRANGDYTHIGGRSLFGTGGISFTGVGSADNFIALGAPTYTGIGGYGTGADSGIWDGSGYNAALTSSIVGWSWVCVYTDTLTGNRSDTGASFTLTNTSLGSVSLSSMETVTLALPRPPRKGIKIDLYRAPIEKVGVDSNLLWREYRLKDLRDLPAFLDDETKNKIIRKATFAYTFDTLVAYRYHWVGRYDSGEVVTDTLSYTTLIQRDRIRIGYFPERAHQIFQDGSILYVISDDRLYYTVIDSFSLGNVLNFQVFSSATGDKITNAWPNRYGIAVKKAKESGQMYEFNSRVEPNDGFGCISTQGHIKVEGGDYFVSRNDLIYEKEGEYLERRFVPTKVSQTLKNFSQLSDTMLARARIAYLPSHRQILVNIGDTTYCFDEQTNAWSTWSFKFAGSTLFGVDSTRRGIPSDTLYFFRPGGSAIYRFGTSTTDNGTAITMSAISAPLPINDGWWKSVQGVGVYLSSLDSSNLLVRTRAENNGTVVETHTFTDPYLRRYRRAKFGGKEQAFWHLEFNGTGLYRTAISGYDFIYDRKGSMEDK